MDPSKRRCTGSVQGKARWKRRRLRALPEVVSNSAAHDGNRTAGDTNGTMRTNFRVLFGRFSPHGSNCTVTSMHEPRSSTMRTEFRRASPWSGNVDPFTGLPSKDRFSIVWHRCSAPIELNLVQRRPLGCVISINSHRPLSGSQLIAASVVLVDEARSRCESALVSAYLLPNPRPAVRSGCS